MKSKAEALSLEEDPLYTSRKVAGMFHVSTETIRNWIKAGKMKGEQIDGRFYIRRSEMIRVANEKHGDIG